MQFRTLVKNSHDAFEYFDRGKLARVLNRESNHRSPNIIPVEAEEGASTLGEHTPEAYPETCREPAGSLATELRVVRTSSSTLI